MADVKWCPNCLMIVPSNTDNCDECGATLVESLMEDSTPMEEESELSAGEDVE